MSDWVQIAIGAVGVGELVTLFTLPSIIRKGKAEARASELDNLQKVADGWKELADERQEANAEKDRIIAGKDEKIDGLYRQIGELRDDRDARIEENTTLKVKKATDEMRLCMVRNCTSREPQSGY